MDSVLLSPSVSRPNSPSAEKLPDLVSSNDGFDYDNIEIDPAKQATKPRDPPSPVAAPEAFQDITASVTHADQDYIYTENLTHIYQRQRGGWNATVPDLENSKTNEVTANNGTTSNRSAIGLPNTLSHSTKLPGQPKRLMLLWTMDHDLGNRTILVNDVKEEVELQEPDLQRRVFWR